MDAFFIPDILCEGLNKVNTNLLPGNLYVLLFMLLNSMV